MLIMLDWEGTICRKEIIDEASMRRFDEIGGTVSASWLSEEEKTNTNHELVKSLVAKKYGLHGEEEKIAKMAELFSKHYLAIVEEWGDYAFYEGMQEVLHALYEQHELGIFSTLQRDLITETLRILKIENLFSIVLSTLPNYTKQELMLHLILQKPDVIVADEAEELFAGKESGAKTFLVTWGNNVPEAKEFAGKIINSPKELLELNS